MKCSTTWGEGPHAIQCENEAMYVFKGKGQPPMHLCFCCGPMILKDWEHWPLVVTRTKEVCNG